MSHPQPDIEGKASSESDEHRVRLQKVLANAGVASRRRCEELIDLGRVSVNGAQVLVQGMRIDPETDVVHLDGRRLALSSSAVHLVLNKPRGVFSTMSDEQGRPCVADYVRDRPERLFHVGRLDADSEGLLLLTNDGELAQRLGHPSFEVVKVYLAEVRGTVAGDVARRLRAGVDLDDGPAKADAFRVMSRSGGRTMVEISLHEGRKHIVRRMLEATGHPVTRLVRTQLGPLRLGDQPPGTLRALTATEYGDLELAAGR